VDSLNSELSSALHRAARASIPFKTVGPRRTNWWSAIPGVPAALKQLRKAHRRKSRQNTPENRQSFREAKLEWARISAAAKKASWESLCGKIENPDSHRLVWTVFNRSASRSVRGSPSSVADPSSPLPVSSLHSLNILARHFASVSAAVPTSSLSPDDEAIIRHVHFHAQMAKDFPALDDDFSMSELHDALCHLRRAAAGPDDISPLFLKHTPPAFRSLILSVLNFSWSHGVLPDIWKRANVCPVFKGQGAPESLPKSYRPISLTSVLVKVLERMLLARLIRFLDSRNFFSRFQAGFRPSHSTLDSIYRLIDRIQTAFSSKNYVSVAFLDIVAAFDKVWHDGLLYKVFKAGIQGRSFRWIKAFLSSRWLRVIFGNEFSAWSRVGAGVPQGSILGPLLFLIFLNDLPLPPFASFALFADDIAVWSVFNGKRGDQALNRALSLIYDWSVRWHVLFSQAKSVSMAFTRKVSPISPLPLSFGPLPLARSSRFKYLGLTLRPDLRWHDHCNRIISAASHAAFRIARIVTPFGPSPRVIRQLVLTTVLPIISYGWPLWAAPSKRHWAKLAAAICLPLRCALGLPPNTHRLALFVETGLLSPQIDHQRLCLAFAHRCYAYLTPHASHYLFLHQYLLPLKPGTPKSQVRLGQSAAALESEWRVKIRFPLPHVLPGLAFQRQLQELSKSKFSTRFKALSPPASACAYVLRDPRSTAILRARIRLNRTHFNDHLFTRKLAPNPFCGTCPTERETAHHVIFDCPAHDAARFALSNALTACDAPFSLAVITGDVSALPPKCHKEVLAVTAKFLASINVRRPI
jgi:hypothetical protein